jgi:hypothetical protein
MKFFRNILMAVLILSILMSIGVSAFAEHQYGGSGWAVTYTEKGKLTSNFAGKIDSSSAMLQPGDDITFTVTVRNNYSTDASWYMSNDILRSLEDSSAIAHGGAYTYTLSYSGRSTPLFDSNTVGGEIPSSAGEGLHGVDSALKNYFYLDTLSPGQSATITLKVSLDGETQGNAYRNTLARLEMNFAVERMDGTSKIVKTGDDTRLAPLYIVMTVSGLLLMWLAVLSMRERRLGRKEGRV